MTDDEYQLMGYAAINAEAATFLNAAVLDAGGELTLTSNSLALARAGRVRTESDWNDVGLLVLTSIVIPRAKVRP